MNLPDRVGEASGPDLVLHESGEFAAWLGEQRASIVFTTYQAGKLFFVGLQDGSQRLSLFERTFNRCMGLWATPQSLHVSTLYQLWRFENTLESGQTYDGYDRVYVPRVAYTTGDLDVHDVAVDARNRILFANTRFNCVAMIDGRHNFAPVWRPSFISALVAEDRCHLNGIALRDGRLRYASCVSRSDRLEGWRDERVGGGIVVDVDSGEVAVSGLTMPHSPRWHADRLWLHDSGTGRFGWVDMERGRFEPVAFCPGYLRGLSFHGEYALVGLSLPRGETTFSGLPLDDLLRRRNVMPVCALQVIDLKSGKIAHSLRLEGAVRELYDVAVLPGVIRPMGIGLKTDEIQRMVSVGPAIGGDPKSRKHG